ncbi:MAG: ATP phosphoribosyltransferase [Chloroflexi bacterium]|nr:ATP phosphoribosyltransferase [Chloroflexota bacterium]
MQAKIALPKGRLLSKTAALCRKAGWSLEEYHEDVRSYHLKSEEHHHLRAKVFHEKDIPIQVAVGNYDLGICGLDWIEELQARYPGSALVKIRGLGYGEGSLYVAASDPEMTLSAIQARPDTIRIASEYPNLAEYFALKNRLRRFSIFPVWGGAEAYPPESADLALVSSTPAGLAAMGLSPLCKLLDFGAFMIANRASWESKDLYRVVASICDSTPPPRHRPTGPPAAPPAPPVAVIHQNMTANPVKLALPDGHQQTPAAHLLEKAGIGIKDYPSSDGNRRPAIALDKVSAKVIRPQDMPLQVANGNFDLAITGSDWLKDHLYQFPSSPVRKLVDLRFGWVRIVAVTSQEVPVSDVAGLKQLVGERGMNLRVASEYVNIADKYARENHLSPYRVIPTWGASEGFLPDDADLLIENTQTGRTIARHNLRIIDTLFESTACLIGNVHSVSDPDKGVVIDSIARALQLAVESQG